VGDEDGVRDLRCCLCSGAKVVQGSFDLGWGCGCQRASISWCCEYGSGYFVGCLVNGRGILVYPCRRGGLLSALFGTLWQWFGCRGESGSVDGCW